MRFRVQWLGVLALVALGSGLLWQVTSTAEVSAQGRVVTIHDNDAPSPAPPLNLFDPRQAQWRFNPDHVQVRQGESIVFRSQNGNDHPHTVTDLLRTSSPQVIPVSFTAGTRFDSGLIQPGGSWPLPTGLAAGHYPYVCRLHPWMTGVITVTQ
jgi:plastocyanin